MRRVAPTRVLLVSLLTVVAALAPAAASAHPLGNFTVNHYSRLEPDTDQVRIAYVLDMAEIPTFQEQSRYQADQSAYADARAEDIRQNLHLSLNGQPASLRLVQRTLSFPPGQGGLVTLRLEALYAADVARAADGSAAIDLVYRDDNDPNRIGWREIVARSTAGAAVDSSSVAATDVTDELRRYPEDLLSSPLDVRAAHLTFTPSAAPLPVAGAAAATSNVPVLDRGRGALADLAGGGELTPSFILFALAVASVLGMAHALQPGHGKTVVAAYLIGSRGTARHALFLGATVTATHTAGVYALGFVTLFLSHFILPERLYPILEIVSGLLVVGIGLYLFGNRLLSALRTRLGRHHEFGHVHHHGHGHDHEHPHGYSDQHPHELVDGHSHGLEHQHEHDDLAQHEYEHAARGQYAQEHHQQQPGLEHPHLHQHQHGRGKPHLHQPALERPHQDQPGHEQPHLHQHGRGKPHTHLPSGPVTWRSLLALGVSGGLLPCPEALMVLLITVAAHRVLFGLLLIVAFSTGLASVLIGFGLLLVFARGLFQRVNVSSGLAGRLLPVGSAAVIVVAGAVITAQALPQVLA